MARAHLLRRPRVCVCVCVCVCARFSLWVGGFRCHAGSCRAAYSSVKTKMVYEYAATVAVKAPAAGYAAVDCTGTTA